ncbi:MAG: hypothetical protein VYC39_05415, partial [Myxococcota bacterium]|nr:hypothetical protein [Myxococcota bacterium]
MTLLSSVGCFEIIDSDVEVKISCDSSSDCPDGASCDRTLNVCTCDDSPGTFAPQCTTCLPQFEGENCDQCSNKNFTGANCDQCSNPRKTGSSCNRCKEGYTGSDCELCEDVRYTGDNCDQCSRRFTGLACNQCAEGFTGENCDVCSDPRYAGEFCDRCSSKFTGPYCTECSSPRFTGPLCDTCAEGYSGEYCEICADQRFKGDNCDECADARYKGPECEQRRYGWRPVTTDNAPSPRYGHTMVVLGNFLSPKRVFVWGGQTDSQYFDDGAIYDPIKDTWSSNKHRGGSRLRSRAGHSMVHIGNGRVIVWGG